MRTFAALIYKINANNDIVIIIQFEVIFSTTIFEMMGKAYLRLSLALQMTIAEKHKQYAERFLYSCLGNSKIFAHLNCRFCESVPFFVYSNLFLQRSVKIPSLRGGRSVQKDLRRNNHCMLENTKESWMGNCATYNIFKQSKNLLNLTILVTWISPTGYWSRVWRIQIFRKMWFL